MEQVAKKRWHHRRFRLIQRRRAKRWIAITAAVTLSVFNGIAVAVPITSNPLEAGVTIQGPGPDSDFTALTEFFGANGTEKLGYQTWIMPSAWIAELSGTYRGSTVAVTYNGDLSHFLTDQTVDWTSTGTVGSLAWSGTGSAMFVDTAQGFNILYNSAVTVGPHFADFEGTIVADRSAPFDFTFIPSPPQGTFAADSTKRRRISWTQDEKLQKDATTVTISDIHITEKDGSTSVRTLNFYDEKKGNFEPKAPQGFPYDPVVGIYQEGFIRSVPEPSSPALFVIGVLGLLSCKWWVGRNAGM